MPVHNLVSIHVLDYSRCFIRMPSPDNITPRILKAFAHEFAEPVCVSTLPNTSLTSGTFPAVWKVSCISPIPKVSQSCGRYSTYHSHPLSATKVLEDFVVQWIRE